MWTKFRLLPLRWKISGLGLLGLLILGWVWYAYRTSPLWVVHRTFAALDRWDAEALVALASEKERRLMNLTPQTVEACLRETWWRSSANQAGRPGDRMLAGVHRYS